MNPKIETVDRPARPWTKTVTLRGLMPAAVVPVAADVTGTGSTCGITHEGKVLTKETGEGLAAAGGCIAQSPVGGRLLPSTAVFGF